METLDKGAVDAVAALAKQSGSQLLSVSVPKAIPGLPPFVPVLVHPETGKVTGLYDQLAPWRTSPERKAGTANVATLESFVNLVNHHKQADSAIFAATDWQKPSLTAVIDYHGKETPDNGKHRVHYQFPLSEEWKAWLAINCKGMPQLAFAEFIENRIEDLSSPSDKEMEDYEAMFASKVGFPNEIVQMSRGLQINVENRIKQVVKLQSGESQILFEEDHKTATGQPLVIPGVFILQIAPFFQGDAARIPVRLRYRKSDGNLIWFCEMYRPDKYITEHVRADLDAAAKATELPKYEGSPEMSGGSSL
ncbi:DUF2303 family protein [Rhizobium sp. Leaf386]|uniref:DUF2303 family protein n=1 Tax=Rhizobium sp. Leaf386 TaxID=1736359 RepID=UPI000712541A|nr:DUF2303 family protein [Rhizobium sp. Leaf386]KQS90326.1 hypothetical protein ASG50_07680 [Rhizobium sp. Leaf386]